MPRHLLDLDWPVRTERLLLRPAEQRDAAPTYAIRSQEAVSQWLTQFPQDPEAWAAGFGERAATTLVVEVDGRVVGDLFLRVEDAWSQAEVREQAVGTVAEIGYAFDPTCAGRGYATEAVREELRLCFEGIGVRRVVASCFADNAASWRLMERVGMRREVHTVAESLHRDGRWLDGYGYALLEQEWRARRSG